MNRLKNGVASVHPLSGQNIRALRKLKRDYPDTRYIFITERKGPLVADTVRKTIRQRHEKEYYKRSEIIHIVSGRNS